MELTEATTQLFDELKVVLDHISGSDYTRPVPVLNSSTVGQHVRHILEFFICLNEGYSDRSVNYDLRKRDREIEQDQTCAVIAANRILSEVSTADLHREMILEMSYDPNGINFVRVSTNYQRELAYNIEHAVHHMALIRIGVESIAPYVPLSKDFGVAVSTVRHHHAVINE